MRHSRNYFSRAHFDADRPDQQVPRDPRTLTAESRFQIEKLRAVARDLIASGAMGDPNDDYHVTIAGIADDAHPGVPGASHDGITLNISRLTYTIRAKTDADAHAQAASE